MNQQGTANVSFLSLSLSLSLPPLLERSRNEIPRVEPGPFKTRKQYGLFHFYVSVFTSIRSKKKCPCALKISCMEGIWFSSFLSFGTATLYRKYIITRMEIHRSFNPWNLRLNFFRARVCMCIYIYIFIYMYIFRSIFYSFIYYYFFFFSFLFFLFFFLFLFIRFLTRHSNYATTRREQFLFPSLRVFESALGYIIHIYTIQTAQDLSEGFPERQTLLPFVRGVGTRIG